MFEIHYMHKTLFQQKVKKMYILHDLNITTYTFYPDFLFKYVQSNLHILITTKYSYVHGWNSFILSAISLVSVTILFLTRLLFHLKKISIQQQRE